MMSTASHATDSSYTIKTLENPENGLMNLIGRLGFVHYVILIFLVPNFFIPPQWFAYATISPSIQIYKEVFCRLICVLIICLGGLRLIGSGFAIFRYALLPILGILSYLFFAALSALFSEVPATSFSHLLTEALLWLVVVLSPLFLTSVNRVCWLVLGGIASLVFMSIFCIGSPVTGTGILTMIYGANIREIIETGLAESGTLEGGLDRSIYMSTLGNPEYVGTFLSAGVLLLGSWIWSGCPLPFGKKRTDETEKELWTRILIGLVIFGVVLLSVLLTRTRGGLLVIGFGFGLWVLAQSPIRGRYAALMALISVLGLFFFGFFGGAIAAAVTMLIVIVILFRDVKDWITRSSFQKHQKALLAIGLGVIIVGGAATVFVSPVKNRAVVLFERVGEGISTQDRSVRERLMFYLYASEMVKDEPLLGTGPGLYSSRYHEAASDLVAADDTGVIAYNQILLRTWVADDTHNDYFQIISEHGIIGIVLFLFLIVAILERLLTIVRSRDANLSPFALILLITILGYLIMMITSFPLQEVGRIAFFMAIMSGAISLLTIYQFRLDSMTRPN